MFYHLAWIAIGATILKPTPTLKRSVSLPLLTFYGIGTIVGAGIYVLVGKVAGTAGVHAPFAFLIASVLAAFSAFSYAELSARFPLSAGEAVYVQHGLGTSWLPALVGLMIVAIGVVSGATMVHGFAGYLQVFVRLPDGLVLGALTLTMGAVVAWGITQSVMLASIITVLELAGLLIILWVTPMELGLEGFTTVDWLPPAELGVWIGIASAAFIAFYAYVGFEDMVNVAEEVKDAPRNLPRAVIIALVVTSTLYLLVAAASVAVVPPAELSASSAPLALVYERASGGSPTFIAIISLMSVINGVLIQIVMASRVLYGMGRQGWLPSRLAHVHPRTRTPLLATAIVTALILVFALWLPVLTLARLTSFVTLTVFALVNLSLWRVKCRDAGPVTVFSVPSWLPLLGFVVCSAFLAFQLVLAVHDMG